MATFKRNGGSFAPDYAYIATDKYNYPYPEEEIGVYLYTGHRQISKSGQEEVLQIGIQAKRTPFEKLPTMNLAFVVDNSSSMYSENKMDWVKESFDIFISKVRNQDFVSLIFHRDHTVRIYSSIQMDSNVEREYLSKAIHSVKSGGAEQFYRTLKRDMNRFKDIFMTVASIESSL